MNAFDTFIIDCPTLFRNGKVELRWSSQIEQTRPELRCKSCYQRLRKVKLKVTGTDNLTSAGV